MKWDILGMNDVRLMGQGIIMTDIKNTFYYSGDNTTAQQEVGILLTTQVNQHVKGFLPVTAWTMPIKKRTIVRCQAGSDIPAFH